VKRERKFNQPPARCGIGRDGLFSGFRRCVLFLPYPSSNVEKRKKKSLCFRVSDYSGKSHDFIATMLIILTSTPESL